MTFTSKDAYELLEGLRCSIKSSMVILKLNGSGDSDLFKSSSVLNKLASSAIEELKYGVNDVEDFKQRLSDLAVRVGYLESVLYTGKADTYFEPGHAAETEKRTVKRFYEGKL